MLLFLWPMEKIRKRYTQWSDVREGDQITEKPQRSNGFHLLSDCLPRTDWEIDFAECKEKLRRSDIARDT